MKRLWNHIRTRVKSFYGCTERVFLVGVVKLELSFTACRHVKYDWQVIQGPVNVYSSTFLYHGVLHLGCSRGF